MKFAKFKLPIRTVFLYLIFGSLWVLLSDSILFFFVPASRDSTVFQTLKGWFFILISGSLLYFLLARELSARRDVEDAMQLSEERLTGIVESAMEGIISIDGDQHIVLVNPAAAEMLGYKEIELLGKPLDILIPPSYRQIHRKYVDQFSLTGMTRRTRDMLGEIYCLHADGTVFPVEASLSHSESDGQRIYTVILRDMSERKKVEQELKETRELFQKSFNLSPVASALSKVADRSIINVNTAMEKLLGYSREELIGKPGTDFDYWVDPESRQSAYEMLLKQGRVRDYEFTYRNKQGRIGLAVLYIEAIEQHGEKYFLTNFIDITERKLAEEELRRSEEKYRTLVETAEDVILLTDLNGKHLYRNSAYFTSLGFDVDEDVDLDGYARVHPNDLPRMKQTSDDLMQTGALVNEYRVQHKDGHWLTRQAKVVTLYDQAHNPEAFLSIIRDITKRKGVEEALRISEQTAHQMADSLRMVNEIGTKITSGLDLERLLQALYEECQRIGDTDQFYVSLYDDATEMLSFPFNYENGQRSPIASRRNHTIRGFTEYILEHRQTLNVADTYTHPPEGVLNRKPDEPTRSYIGVPLMVKDRVVGVLSMQSHAPNAYTPEQIHTLELLATQAAIAIHNAQLFEQAQQEIVERKRAQTQIQQQLQRLNSLRTIDTAISSSFDIHVTLDVVLQQVLAELGVDAASILLFNNNDNTLVYSTGKGFHTPTINRSNMHLGDGYAGRVGLERKTIHVPNLAALGQQFNRTELLKDEDFVVYIGVPLISKGLLKGVLELFHRSELKTNPKWLDFLETLAGQAAIAIDNAQLFDNLQRSKAELEQRVAQRTAELNQTNIELEHANHAKDEFLATMSHELRTPLNSILGLSETLLEQRRDPLSERQQKSLQIIASSGSHLLELINDILDISKIEAGKMDYHPQPIEVNVLCRSSLAFIREQATRKQITLQYDEDVTASTIHADPRRVKQILVNLLTNAVKFTPDHGQVTIQVHADAEQELIQISVIDTGIGIAEADLQRLFQPFVQVDSSLTREYEGTGLGLALVQKLTDLHGGSVRVESEPGKGSCFTINLPWRQEAMLQPETLHSEDEFRPTDVSAPSIEPGRRKVVLLAEDSMANILTIGEYLESHGYQVIVAQDGLEAIAKAQEINPNLILMDIQMPAMNGLEAISRLRADERFGKTPIIALTALAMPGDRERCIAAGADEYMSKPVSLKGLLKTISSMLEEKKK